MLQMLKDLARNRREVGTFGRAWTPWDEWTSYVESNMVCGKLRKSMRCNDRISQHFNGALRCR